MSTIKKIIKKLMRVYSQKIGAGLNITGLAGCGLGIGGLKYLSNYQKSYFSVQNFLESFLGLPIESEKNLTISLDSVFESENFIISHVKQVKSILNNKNYSLLEKQTVLDKIPSLKNCNKYLIKVEPLIKSKSNFIEHAFRSVRSIEKKEVYYKFNQILVILEKNNELALNLFASSLQESLSYLFRASDRKSLTFKKFGFVTHFTAIFLDKFYKIIPKNSDNILPEFNRKEFILLSFHFGSIMEISNLVLLKRSTLKGDKTAYVYIFKKNLLQTFVGLRYLGLPRLVEQAEWVLSDVNLNAALPVITQKIDFMKMEEEELLKCTKLESIQLKAHNRGVGIHSRNTVKIVRATKDLSVSLNYLQSQIFIINRSCLNFINANKIKCLLEFLKSFDLKSLSVFNTVYDKRGEILSLEIKRDLEPTDLLSIKSFSSFVLGHSSGLIADEQMLENDYKIYLGRILHFVTTFVLANIFRNYLLWFSNFVDFRSRAYFFGTFIKPQGNCLSNFLLDFPAETKNARSSEEAISLKAALKKLEAESVLHGKQFFELRRLEFRSTSVIGLDVSSSGSQILSGLTGYAEGLIKTNLIYKGARNKNEDFYLEIRLKFLDYFNNEKNKIKTLVFDKSLLDLSVKTLLSIFDNLEVIFDRKFVKYWVMRFFYSEGNNSRSKQLYEVFYSLDSTISKIPTFAKFCFRIAALLRNFIDSPLIAFSDFIKKKFKSVSNNSTFLSLSNNYISSSVRYTLKVDSQFNYQGQNSNMAAYNYFSDTNEADRPRLLRGCIVHLVHLLDAALAHTVILEAKKREIALFTNHDCFYVAHKNTSLIKEIYFQSFIKVILEDNVLESYLKLNNIELDKNDLKQLAKWSKARKLLIKKIKRSDFKQSFYVLNP